MLGMSIYVLLLDGVELLLLCAFCMLTIDYTLGEKRGKRKRFAKWLLTVFSGVLLQALVTIVITNFETYVNKAISQAGKLEMTLDVLVSLVYALYNAFQMLLPTFISLFAAMWLYKQQKSIKIFTTVLVGLGASIIFEYVYGIAILPFSNVLPEKMVKIAPPIFLSASILALILGIFYVLYRRKLYEKLKNLLDTPDGRVDSFVKIPVISSMIFALLISTLHTFGIYLMTRVWSDVMIYIVVFGCLIFIYILMYWSIFKGITLSTQSMRNRAELDVAKHIQESVLPNTFPAFPQRKEFSIHASMDPAKEVGGDFYDFFFTDENHLAVVIADVSGKGIPAALFMMTSRTLLKNLTTPGRSPEKVLTEVNNLLCENNETEMFVTAWLGIVEVDTGRLVFANAGHNPPLLKTGNGEYRYLDHKTYKRSIMLGMRENISYRSNEIWLNPKDFLFLYTDGVTEAVNLKDELFGEERLKDCAERHRDATPEAFLRSVKTEMDAFVGDAQQFDDITMLALELNSISGVYETGVETGETSGALAFTEEFLTKRRCSLKIIRQALVATDEIFSNILRYSGADKATIRCQVAEQELILIFEDNGSAYNPLVEKEPDLSIPVGERAIGGLGIFVVKKLVDKVSYVYRDGKNVLTLLKKL